MIHYAPHSRAIRSKNIHIHQWKKKKRKKSWLPKVCRPERNKYWACAKSVHANGGVYLIGALYSNTAYAFVTVSDKVEAKFGLRNRSRATKKLVTVSKCLFRKMVPSPPKNIMHAAF